MAERRIGLIPSVSAIVDGNQTYSILVTDRRVILVPESAPSMSARDFLNDMFRDRQGRGEQVEIDFEATPIDSIAGFEGSKSIPVSSIRKLRLGSLLGTYDMTIEYSDDEGKMQSEVFSIIPPSELTKSNKAQGISSKETKRRYALKCQELLRRTVPPLVASESRWLE